MMRLRAMPEALDFTTGNEQLDAMAKRAAGLAIADLSQQAGISHPEALGLLQAIFTFEIARLGAHGLPYLQACTVWMAEADKAEIDGPTLDAIEVERESRFEKWKGEAQAAMEAAHAAITQNDGDTDAQA